MFIAVAKFKDRRPNVVVIGSSFIGMEMASVLASSAKVTVVAIEKVTYYTTILHLIQSSQHDLDLGTL
jgi:NADH dehydrogenase FAD-containing subunit